MMARQIGQLMPEEIDQLITRCETKDASFDNDDMSIALKFGELLWRRLTRMAEHYEGRAGNFSPSDCKGRMLTEAAKDMRHVLADCVKDC